MKRVRIIDSHTGGEPTRIVVSGGPDLGTGNLADRLKCFREVHDRFRSAVVNEPRGSDVMVGGLLTQPTSEGALAGVLFFNNVGYLGMCGHGTIGLIATLAHLGRIRPGSHQIDTPVGPITAVLHEDGRVSIRNVASYRLASGLKVTVPGLGEVTGDVAWGGNWFFLVRQPLMPLDVCGVEELRAVSLRIRSALETQGITGSDGAAIDHVELFGPCLDPRHDSRNFVLCPGGAYDRSPCGTGTSAKLACLVADGELAAGEIWLQEGILGSVFEGSVEIRDGMIFPTITGRAWVNADSELILDESDPYCWGIP